MFSDDSPSPMRFRTPRHAMFRWRFLGCSFGPSSPFFKLVQPCVLQSAAPRRSQVRRLGGEDRFGCGSSCLEHRHPNRRHHLRGVLCLRGGHQAGVTVMPLRPGRATIHVVPRCPSLSSNMFQPKRGVEFDWNHAIFAPALEVPECSPGLERSNLVFSCKGVQWVLGGSRYCRYCAPIVQ